MEAKVTLTGVIHGPSGVGKSWFLDTAPGPKLVIDLEGRARYTPSGPKVWWDPMASAPPDPAQGWQTCIVTAASYATLDQAYQWLRSGQHGFVSCGIDSVMEAQQRCVDDISPTMQQFDQQDWGTLKRKLERLIRDYRDLTLLSSNTIETVMFLTGSVDDGKKQRPLLQGGLKDTLPYLVDLVGYMFKAPQTEGNFIRSMLVDEQPGFVAKDGTGRFVSAYPGGIIPNPNLTEMRQLLANQNPEPAVAAAPIHQEVAAV